MLFNSLSFAVFLPCVFLLYWFVFSGNERRQNFFLVAASLFFYAWWDWRCLFLIAFTAGTTWASGLAIERARERRLTKASHADAEILTPPHFSVKF